jgi:flotillin
VVTGKSGVKRAQFKVVADTELAKANQALGIATAEQERVLRVRQAERDAAEKEALTEVQRKEAARKQQELEATVVRVADAERQKVVIQAEAAKQAVILQAEAEMESRRKRAEGEKQANMLLGEGEAPKTRATMLAQADGEAAMKRQVMVAEAEGEAAKRGKVLLAEAEGEAAKKGKILLAEAEGTRKLAKALAQMTESAKLILILDRLPGLLEKGGDAFAKVASATFASVAAPLGNIDELRIIDVGGSGRGLDQLSSVVPNTVFKTLASLKAQGVDVSRLLSKLGVDIVELDKMLGTHEAAAVTPQPEAAEGAAEAGAQT